MSVARDIAANSSPFASSVQRYLEVALFLLVLCAFATLTSTGGLDLPVTAFVVAALFARGCLLATRRSILIPESWTTVLTVAYVGFYLGDLFLLGSGFINATVHLVLFVMVVRLFSAHRDRDYYFLALIAFLMVLASAILTVDSLFLLGFAGFMLAGIATVILMEMKHSSAATTAHGRFDARPVVRSLSALSPVLGLCILVVATGIFFVLPRVSTGYFSAYSRKSELVTGFSDDVQLGGIGEIQQSDAVVMHIQIDGDDRGRSDFKWRGVTLSTFSGRRWSHARAEFVVPRLPGGDFAVWPSEARWNPPRTRQETIHYRVLMEPMGTNVFFLAPLSYAMRGNYRQLIFDPAGAVFDIDPEHPVSRYEAWARLPLPPDVAQKQTGEDSHPPDSIYLEYPALDPRIPELARQVTASAATDYDKARAIESYLQNNLAYTLQLPAAPPADPLANFLFERKRGHCEYFASAMAIMLRTLGIPSRLVNGFRTGEFNDVTSQYVIRGSNAHSWVEADIRGQGWVDFDPTPAAAIPNRTGWGRVLLYVDAAKSFWREWIINYDVGHQQGLARESARNSQRWFRGLRHWSRMQYGGLLNRIRGARAGFLVSPVRWSLVAVLIAAVMLLLIKLRPLLVFLRKRRAAAHPERAPRLAATLWYERMTGTMARRGWHKRPAQTPREFVNLIDDAEVRTLISEFNHHYECARFSDSIEDAQRLPELYEKVETAARR